MMKKTGSVPWPMKLMMSPTVDVSLRSGFCHGA
jgi:hypothetical protein